MFLLSCIKIALRNKEWEEVSRFKEELDSMLCMDAYGFVVRSRFNQNMEGETASLFHAAREFKNKKNCLPKMRINDQITDDKIAIEEEVTNYFNALFNGHHDSGLVNTGTPFVPDDLYLSDLLDGLSSLDTETSDYMHRDIEADEIDLVVKGCSSNKAPGLDGLSYEFYKTTWNTIRETFCAVLQCQLDRGSIIETNKIGATRLISKVSGIPKVDELRPVTLLNCDYRILSKLLVQRMKPTLPIVIKSGQLCTVDKKNILFGVSNIISSLVYANQRNRKACMICLDF